MKTISSLTCHIKHALALITALALVVTNWATADETPNFDDPKVREKIFGEAGLRDTLEERGAEGAKLLYAPKSQTPFTGWAKSVYDNGKVAGLVHFKDGKQEGLATMWHDNGQKKQEANSKDGKLEGLATAWDENGKKEDEKRY